MIVRHFIQITDEDKPPSESNPKLYEVERLEGTTAAKKAWEIKKSEEISYFVSLRTGERGQRAFLTCTCPACDKNDWCRHCDAIQAMREKFQ